MPPTSRTGSRQKAELTFKYNQHHGRHGWLRLTPAYSVKLVNDILATADSGIAVLDPFSGTGTTPLSAAYRNDAGTGIEINPFLTWLGRAKVAKYAPEVIIETQRVLGTILSSVSSEGPARAAPPPMHNVERWWDAEELSFLSALKAAIEGTCDACSQSKDLLLVGFSRILIKLSNAAFNHQSMSFKEKDSSQGLLFAEKPDFSGMFRKEMVIVLESAADNPPGRGEIVTGDSRQTSSSVEAEYDLLITSPPYPNRMSYIRELRPYMYWLGYLKNGREAGNLDWSAIGGTWGIATSRLTEWERPQNGFWPAYFRKALDDIANSDNKNGMLLSNYVAKYFADMWLHVKDIGNVMAEGAEFHYIIGNSTFYQVLVPVEILFRDMFREAGFRNVRITKIRKRNSKKELYEYDVAGQK